MTATLARGGWGRAIWFPVAAAILGIGGGFVAGRVLRQPPPAPNARYAYARGGGDEEIEPDAGDGATGAGGTRSAGDTAAGSAQAPPGETPAKSAAPVAETAHAKGGAVAAAISPEKVHPAAETAPAVAKPPPAAKAKAHILSNPIGVQVARASDGEVLGTTPFDLELPASDKALKLLFWKKGFAIKEETIIPRGELSLNVDLVAAQAAAPAPRPKRRAPKPLSATTTIDPFQ